MMYEILGLRLSGYALSIWIAGMLALLLFLREGKKLKKPARVWTILLGIPLGLFCARLYYVLARLELFLDLGLENFFFAAEEDLRIWGSAGGAAFWGTVGGVALAALAAGKISGEKAGAILDALAPSAALGIAISRIGEYAIGEGIGPDVGVESLCVFPLAVVNEWGEWKYAVFLLEALVDLIIFLLLITRGRRFLPEYDPAAGCGAGEEGRSGYRARMFLILYGASQILLEALRRDNFLRWLFVRVSQVASAVVLLLLLVFGILRWMKRNPVSRMSRGRLIACCALFGLLVGAVVALEFAVDKSPTLSVAAAYLLEGVCCVGMGISVWQVSMKN